MMIRVGAAIAVLAVAAALALTFLRPPVESTSRTDPDVVIACAAATNLSVEACQVFGDGILAAGPPSQTFEMDDLARLVVDRQTPVSATCEISYFISRDANNRVWGDQVECPDA